MSILILQHESSLKYSVLMLCLTLPGLRRNCVSHSSEQVMPPASNKFILISAAVALFWLVSGRVEASRWLHKPCLLTIKVKAIRVWNYLKHILLHSSWYSSLKYILGLSDNMNEVFEEDGASCLDRIMLRDGVQDNGDNDIRTSGDHQDTMSLGQKIISRILLMRCTSKNWFEWVKQTQLMIHWLISEKETRNE